jgi:hypothetical protein
MGLGEARFIAQAQKHIRILGPRRGILNMRYEAVMQLKISPRLSKFFAA